MSKSESRSALVTGATGFIGSHLCLALFKAGWDVHVVSRPSSSLEQFNLGPWGSFKKSYTNHCFEGETSQMVDILGRAQPNVVFHLAACVLSDHRPGDLTKLIEANITFGSQLIEAVSLSSSAPVINTGTCWEHFGEEQDEAVCLYAATKQAFESILDFYRVAKGIDYLSLKLFDSYGPYDPRKKLFSLFRTNSAGEDVLKMSPGQQVLNLVHVSDIVEAYLCAAESLLGGESGQGRVFSVQSEETISLRELAELYEAVSERKLKIEWGGRPYRDREVMSPWEGCGQLPNWKPKIGLKQGIEELVRLGY